MTTAGGLLFAGSSDGFVKTFEAKNGNEVWEFQTCSSIVSVLITWKIDGEQYVDIQSV